MFARGRVRRSAILVLWVAFGVTMTGCKQHASDITGAPTERHKALVRWWIEEGFNQRRLTVVDELFAVQFAVNGIVIGQNGLKQSMSRHLDGFPDLYVFIEDVVAEGSQVGIWYTAEGTHRGEFEAIPPTGNHVKWSGFDLMTIEGGKISKARFLSDHLGLLSQLGATVSLPRTPERSQR